MSRALSKEHVPFFFVPPIFENPNNHERSCKRIFKNPKESERKRQSVLHCNREGERIFKKKKKKEKYFRIQESVRIWNNLKEFESNGERR